MPVLVLLVLVCCFFFFSSSPLPSSLSAIPAFAPAVTTLAAGPEHGEDGDDSGEEDDGYGDGWPAVPLVVVLVLVVPAETEIDPETVEDDFEEALPPSSR